MCPAKGLHILGYNTHPKLRLHEQPCINVSFSIFCSLDLQSLQTWLSVVAMIKKPSLQKLTTKPVSFSLKHFTMHFSFLQPKLLEGQVERLLIAQLRVSRHLFFPIFLWSCPRSPFLLPFPYHPLKQSCNNLNGSKSSCFSPAFVSKQKLRRLRLHAREPKR